MKKPSSDTAPSEQDKETIRLIELIAMQVRKTIEAGTLAEHRTAGPRA